MDYTGHVYSMVFGIIAVLGVIIGYVVIPTESTEENKPLLWGILGANFLFSIAIFLIVYSHNETLKENIFHASIALTCLVALPTTLYGLGVSSILFSN
jgi:zinc transporter ZupT